MSLAQGSPSQRMRLALALRQAREDAGLSTRQLGVKLGVSQSRISRIENGRPVKPNEVRAWATATGLSGDQAAELGTQAALALVESTPWRSGEPGGLVAQQQRVAEWEASAGTVRVFQNALVPGPLQTAEYMRRVFELIGADDVEAGITARLNRQSALLHGANRKTCEFLITEGALRWRPGPASMLRAQLGHIGSVMTLPNVRVGLLPFDAEAPTFYDHPFFVFEDREDEEDALVVVDTIAGELTIGDPAGVLAHQRRLALLRPVALYDDEARALLERVGAEQA